MAAAARNRAKKHMTPVLFVTDAKRGIMFANMGYANDRFNYPDAARPNEHRVDTFYYYGQVAHKMDHLVRPGAMLFWRPADAVPYTYMGCVKNVTIVDTGNAKEMKSARYKLELDPVPLAGRFGVSFAAGQSVPQDKNCTHPLCSPADRAWLKKLDGKTRGAHRLRMLYYAGFYSRHVPPCPGIVRLHRLDSPGLKAELAYWAKKDAAHDAPEPAPEAVPEPAPEAVPEPAPEEECEEFDTMITEALAILDGPPSAPGPEPAPQQSFEDILSDIFDILQATGPLQAEAHLLFHRTANQILAGDLL